jgi:hypothetical protein
VHSDCQLNNHDLLALRSKPGAHRWSNLPHQTSYKNYRETPPHRPTADFVLGVCMPNAFGMSPTTKPDRREATSTSAPVQCFAKDTLTGLNYHDLLALTSELGAHQWSNLPHQTTTYKMYRETPPQRSTADFVLAFNMLYALTMSRSMTPIATAVCCSSRRGRQMRLQQKRPTSL